MAKEYKNYIDTGFAKNESDLAKKLNISRVRVNQIMSLLKLDKKIIRLVEDIGDPMQGKIISERKLRPLVKLPAEEQIESINTTFPVI